MKKRGFTPNSVEMHHNRHILFTNGGTALIDIPSMKPRHCYRVVAIFLDNIFYFLIFQGGRTIRHRLPLFHLPSYILLHSRFPS